CRYRLRHRVRNRGATLQAIRHHETTWHGDWSIDIAYHRRVPWRTDYSEAQSGRRNYFLLYASRRRSGRPRRWPVIPWSTSLTMTMLRVTLFHSCSVQRIWFVPTYPPRNSLPTLLPMGPAAGHLRDRGSVSKAGVIFMCSAK